MNHPQIKKKLLRASGDRDPLVSEETTLLVRACFLLLDDQDLTRHESTERLVPESARA